jgi:signal peptidase I
MFKKFPLYLNRVFLLIICFLVVSEIRFATVDGCSMEPTLETGDCVLYSVSKEPEIGDIVIIAPTIFHGNYMIKRITDISEDKIFVEGDNKPNSYDSRRFGWLDKDLVVGVVVFK